MIKKPIWNSGFVALFHAKFSSKFLVIYLNEFNKLN